MCILRACPPVLLLSLFPLPPARRDECDRVSGVGFPPCTLRQRPQRAATLVAVCAVPAQVWQLEGEVKERAVIDGEMGKRSLFLGLGGALGVHSASEYVSSVS